MATLPGRVPPKTPALSEPQPVPTPDAAPEEGPGEAGSSKDKQAQRRYKTVIEGDEDPRIKKLNCVVHTVLQQPSKNLIQLEPDGKHQKVQLKIILIAQDKTTYRVQLAYHDAGPVTKVTVYQVN